MDASSSTCRVRALSFSTFVSCGSARIHLCMTVHTFGAGNPCKILFITSWFLSTVSAGVRRCLRSSTNLSSKSSLSSASTMGSIACHCPSSRAVAGQTSGRRRSSGEQGSPSMNLYRRPLLNRASSRGAKRYFANKQCDCASPMYSVSRVSMGDCAYAYVRDQ